MIECSEPLLLLELVHGALYGSTNDYAQDNSGNFVLQAILRRLSAELEQRRRSTEELIAIEAATDVCLTELSTKEFFPYLILQRGGRNYPQSNPQSNPQSILQSILQSNPHHNPIKFLINSSIIQARYLSLFTLFLLYIYPLLVSGVVLWMLELARWRYKQGVTGAGNTVNWCDTLGNNLLAIWTNNDLTDTKLAAVLSDKLSPKAALTTSGNDEPIENDKKPSKSKSKGKGQAGFGSTTDPRDSAQQLVARLIGALLKLEKSSGYSNEHAPSSSSSSSSSSSYSSSSSSSASVSMRVAHAISALPLGTLRHIATSGPLSRAILDTFFEFSPGHDHNTNTTTINSATTNAGDDGNIGDNQKNTTIVATLLQSLTSVAVELADHSIGDPPCPTLYIYQPSALSHILADHSIGNPPFLLSYNIYQPLVLACIYQSSALAYPPILSSNIFKPLSHIYTQHAHV